MHTSGQEDSEDPDTGKLGAPRPKPSTRKPAASLRTLSIQFSGDLTVSKDIARNLVRLSTPKAV